MNLKYKFDSGFNVFSKFGILFTQTSEKLSVESLTSVSYSEYPTVKATSFLPTAVVGFGYEIKNTINLFTQYSYVHGNNTISSFQSVGLGVEFKLPI